MKNIYLIVGPSGVGKTTLVERLVKDHGLRPVESYTTRQPRYPGEKGHIFVPDEEFNRLEGMLAYVEYDGNRYCITKALVDENDLCVIEPSGAQDILECYKGEKGVVVISLTASYSERYSRMKQRGDTTGAIEARLAEDAKTFDYSRYSFSADFSVHADGITETAKAVWEYIQYREKHGYELKVYQIDFRVDADRVIFAGTSALQRMQGGRREVNINLGIYEEVWSGYVDFPDLEAIFSDFNGDSRPNADKMRSLSCSDIVEIHGCDLNPGLGGMWFCDTFGWKKIEGGMIKL